MSDDPISRLSPREREILMLVPRLASSKAISAALGIEPDTVDKTIKRAMAKLGVRNRHVAAQMLLAAGVGNGGAELSQFRESRSQELAAVADSAFNRPVDDADLEGVADGLGEERARFGHARPAGTSTSPWPARTGEGSRNDLSVAMRLFWILAIAIAVILACAAALSALRNLSELVRP